MPVVPAHITITDITTELDVCYSISYPSAAARFGLRCQSLSRAELDTLYQALQSWLKAEDFSNEVCVFPVAEFLQERCPALLSEHRASAATEDDKEKKQDCAAPKAREAFLRAFVWFHHVYNKHKKHDVISTARDLQLGGFLMVGKPGLAVLEGDESSVRQWIARIKGLTWQKMAVKHEQRCEG